MTGLGVGVTVESNACAVGEGGGVGVGLQAASISPNRLNDSNDLKLKIISLRNFPSCSDVKLWQQALFDHTF